MKNFLLFLSIALVAGKCTAQTLTLNKVPPATANAFKVKFPNGSQPGWSKDNTDTYEVNFFNGKKRQSAIFDALGKWIETETEINYNAMPAKVQRAFLNEFNGYQVQEVFEVESPEQVFSYKVITFKGAKNFEVVYSAKGELLKKEEGESNE